MILNKISLYIKKHWRGELSLGISYWINNVIVSAIITVLSNLFSDYIFDVESIYLSGLLFFSFYIVLIFIIVPWIYIGLWRATNRHIEKYHVYFWAYVVRIIIIIGTFQVWITLKNEIYPISKGFYKVFTNKDKKSKYKIKVQKINDKVTILTINGKIEFGLYHDLKEIFKKYPNIKSININSAGGKIKEALHIAKFLEKKNIYTYVETECDSACTYIFLAGKKRVIQDGARLGFHQSNIDGLAREYYSFKKDREYLYTKNIDFKFIEKIFQTSYTTIWYPSYKELLDANIITKVYTPSIKYKDKNSTWLKNKLLEKYPKMSQIIKPSIEDTIKELVKIRGKSLPQKIDKITIQDSIEAKKSRIVYNYTLEEVKDKETHRKFLHKKLEYYGCRDLFTLYLMRNGVMFEYNYFKKDKSKVLTIYFNKCNSNLK